MPAFRRALLALALVLSMPVLAGNIVLPSLGDASSSIVSPKEEYQLGHAWANLLRGKVAQLSDPLLKDYIERSVSQLALSSQVQDKRFEFILLRSREINAFAAPGGIVGINGGLFLHAKTEAEYASVLAHELSHLSQRHFARGVEDQQRMQLPMMAAMLAGIIAAAAGAGDAGMATIMGTQAAAFQSQLHFSRANEEEADRIGLETLQRAGYDPKGMPEMFEDLARQYRYDSALPEYLQDHPVTENRIAYTLSRAEQMPSGGKEDSLEYQLMRARTQLLLEEASGSAVQQFRAALNKNPQSDATRYGLAIALIKYSKLDEAEALLKPLLQKAPDNIPYNLAQSDLDQARGHLAAAAQRLDRLLALNPDNYPVKQAKINVLLRQNQPKQAKVLLEALGQARPRDPDVWYELSEVRGLSGDIIGVQTARAEYFGLTGDYDQALQQLDLARRRAATNFPLAAKIDARYQALKKEQNYIKGIPD